jgi:ABC-type transporter Mla subunit MlaD
MTFKFRNYDKVVGVFVLLGLLGLSLVVIFMGMEQRWFEGKLKLQTFFNTGENLSKGMDVKFNGIAIGRVSKIEFAPRNNIRVDFFVYNSFREKICRNTYVLLDSVPVLGGGTLILARLREQGGENQEIIHTGDDDSKNESTLLETDRLEDGDTLYSEDEPFVRSMIARGEITTTGSINNIIANIDLLTTQLSDPSGALQETMNNVKIITGKLASGSGPAGALLGDPAFTREIHATLQSVNQIMESVNLLSGMLRDSSPNIRNIIGSAEQSLNEATRILVGLQNYLGISARYRTTTSGGDGGSGIIQHNRARQY